MTKLYVQAPGLTPVGFLTVEEALSWAEENLQAGTEYQLVEYDDEKEIGSFDLRVTPDPYAEPQFSSMVNLVRAKAIEAKQRGMSEDRFLGEFDSLVAVRRRRPGVVAALEHVKDSDQWPWRSTGR